MTQIIDNCRLEREDRAFLMSQRDLPVAFKTFARPAEVRNPWHKAENQGQMGSCQGNALTSVLERLWRVSTGETIQLSRIFAYLATQKLDGLIGRDVGSTISGGAKLALNYGVPLEINTGYPSTYPMGAAANKILSKPNYDAGRPYKAVSACAIGEDPEEAYSLIGGGGGISLGILWYQGIIPSDRVIRRYAPPAGTRSGHAVSNLGYLSNGLFEPWNSHRDGAFYITPEAWRQMMKHPYTAAIGLMGNEGSPADWISDSYMDHRTAK